MDGDPIRLFPSLAEEDSGPLVGTPGEFAVLEALGIYGSNKEVAARLRVSVSRVENAMNALRDKNGNMTSKQLLFRYAMQLHDPAA